MKLRCLFFLISIVSILQTASASPETIKIGAIFSVSGWGQTGGKPEADGVALAVEDINKAGGINGRKLELILEDNLSDFKNTATAFQRVFNVKKADVLIGPNWAEFSEVTAPLAQSSKKIMLGTSGYSKTLTHGRDYVFTVMPPHEYFTKPLAGQIKKTNINKLAILANTSAYSLSLANEITRQLKELGLADIEVFEFTLGEKDYRSQLTKIKSENYDGLLNFLISSDFTTALKQIRELKLELPLFCSNVPFYEEEIINNPAVLPEGMIAFSDRISSPEGFNAKFQARFDYIPMIQSPRAYSAVEVYKQAVENCGTTDSTRLKSCIQGKTFNTIIGPITFGKDNLIIPHNQVVILEQVKGGAFKPL